MDDELRAYLDAMRSEFKDQLVLMRAEFNDAQEHLLDRLSGLKRDFQNTKGFLINDAVASGQRWFSLEERVTRLERDRKADG